MKKLILLFTCLFCAFSIHANINFALDYALFKGDKNQQYAEFYLSINGKSIKYGETSPNLFQAKIEITYIIEQGEKVINYKKFLINSPKYTENAVFTDSTMDLMDLKRINFPKGEYTYTIIAKDLYAKTEAQISDDLRSLNLNDTEISFSEIQLANLSKKSNLKNDFTKGGFDITPSVSHVYDNGKNQFISYFEVYNANKTLANDEGYLIDMRIEDAISNKVIANLRAVRRMKAKDVSPIIQQFKLADLPSGSYNFVVEAKNKKNESLSIQHTSFYRINTKLKDLETLSLEGSFVDSIRNPALLTDYIKSARPVANEVEKVWADNQLRYSNLELMQRYFYNFWKDRNPVDPYLAWTEYKAKVDFVDREFGYGGVSGYATERGRVYLQYGAPNSVQNVKYDSDNHPYSVWQYNKIEKLNLTNRKFVFYSPSNEMLGYEVIHSNIPGEIQNEDWEYSINKKNITSRPSRSQDNDPNYQQRAKDLFENPR